MDSVSDAFRHLPSFSDEMWSVCGLNRERSFNRFGDLANGVSARTRPTSCAMSVLRMQVQESAIES